MKRRILNEFLGEILIDWNVINQEQLNETLTIQRNNGGYSLSGEILIELGFAREEHIVQALNAQYRFPYLPVINYDIDPEVIDIIPGQIARKYLIIPIDRILNNLSIAMSNPLNAQALQEVEAVSECNVQVFITTPSDIKMAIDKYYGYQE